GELLDISAHPVRRVSGERVPHGPNVVVGSPEGAGRWILVVDRRAGELIAVDPRTGTRRVSADLPTGPKPNLGAPVVIGDTAYLPDQAQHLLYVRDLATGDALPDIPVPGRSSPFSLEVHGEKVWANDQHDRRAVVVGPDHHSMVVDKGTGENLTDTTTPEDVTEPDTPSPQPVTVPGPLPAEAPPVAAGPAEPADGAPPAPEQVRVPDIRTGTDKDDACERIEEAGLLCAAVATGDEGPADEVIDTEPPGGSMVPAGYRVTVRHYGPRTVPDIVGRFTADACREIETNGLRCSSEPDPDVAASPAELDVVSAQDPAGGADVSAESAISVRYANQAVLADYTNRPAAQACA
ncbi:MAG: PASTA domain-containing protein, partial [Micromonosporaceae bacterium]